MALSYVQYVADGGVGPYTVTYSYINKAHVAVRVAGALKVVDVDYTWPTDSTIQFTSGVTSGLTIDIRRTTSPASRLVDYFDATNLTEEILDLDSLQAFYLAQESIDNAGDSSASALAAEASATDAAASEAAAATSATAAAASATAAAASASAAATSESNAASSEAAAAASYDSFDDRYLGAKSSDPSLDNDGNALLTGALYWNTTANEMRSYSGVSWLTLSGGSALPVGSTTDFAGTSTPGGWLLCYGQAISRTTYSLLFAVISTTFGVGDGSTTFNVPDCRGRVSAGKDNMGGTSANRLTGASGGVDGDGLGNTGGAEEQTLSGTQMPTHGHDTGAYGTDSGASGQARAGAGTQVGTITTTNSGGNGAHNNVQPTIVFNKIIFAGV